MKSSTSSASPIKSAVEEIDFLRHLFRTALSAYGSTIEADIAKLREIVGNHATQKKMPATLVHDARDIVTLIRTLEIKPEKGRRRDLKKIESTVEDLKAIVESWEV